MGMAKIENETKEKRRPNVPANLYVYVVEQTKKDASVTASNHYLDPVANAYFAVLFVIQKSDNKSNEKSGITSRYTAIKQKE